MQIPEWDGDPNSWEDYRSMVQAHLSQEAEGPAAAALPVWDRDPQTWDEYQAAVAEFLQLPEETSPQQPNGDGDWDEALGENLPEEIQRRREDMKRQHQNHSSKMTSGATTPGAKPKAKVSSKK
jgi:hypothetical protein